MENNYKHPHEFNFKEPAIYKIVIHGRLNSKWSDTFMGMQIDIGQRSITSLIGKINDQAALSGILNMLYDMHLTVISVNMLSEIAAPD